MKKRVHIHLGFNIGWVDVEVKAKPNQSDKEIFRKAVEEIKRELSDRERGNESPAFHHYID